jgi:Uma2 family endonuclease
MDTIELLSSYELERGKPMPSLNHSILQSRLLVALFTGYGKTYSILSELTLQMPDKPDAVPDICIYPTLDIDFLHDRPFLEQMPLTAIEIISPSQSNDDVLAKFERYFKAGVGSGWLVLPSFQAISVYAAIGNYQFFTATDTLTDLTSGIHLPLSEIFANP